MMKPEEQQALEINEHRLTDIIIQDTDRPHNDNPDVTCKGNENDGSNNNNSDDESGNSNCSSDSDNTTDDEEEITLFDKPNTPYEFYRDKNIQF